MRLSATFKQLKQNQNFKSEHMKPTYTTVQEILNIFVGRPADEVVVIQNNQLTVQAPVVLLGSAVKFDETPSRIMPFRVETPVAIPAQDFSSHVKRDPKDNTRLRWTEKNLVDLRKMINKGATLDALAEKFGRTPKGISMQLYRMGVSLKKPVAATQTATINV